MIRYIFVFLATFPIFGNAQTSLDSLFFTLDNALGDVYLGRPKAEILALKPTAIRTENLGFREEYVCIIQKNGLVNLAFYFEKKTPAQLLYGILIDFTHENLKNEMIANDLGAPNWPGKPNQWVLVADAEKDGNAAVWTSEKRLTMGMNLPGAEWENDDRFYYPPGVPLPFDGVQETTFPSALENEPAAKLEFLEALEAQMEAALTQFKSIRGALFGEAGVGAVESKLTLNLSGFAIISQNEEGKWTLSNFMAEAQSENDALNYEAQLVDLFSKTTLKNYKIQPSGKEMEPNYYRINYEILNQKGQKLDVQLAIVRMMFEEDKTWSVDLEVVKN
jgi:hypothetical protein